MLRWDFVISFVNFICSPTSAMNESFDHIDLMTRVPALAESEDMESEGTDFDESEFTSSVVVDRYGFSGGQQYTDPTK